jgi:hypothetical protein
MDYQKLLSIALEEARSGLAEGGIPVGAALFDTDGTLWAADTTVVYRRVTLRYMVKPMHFARPVAKKLTVTKSWSLRLHLAGIVAV